MSLKRPSRKGEERPPAPHSEPVLSAFAFARCGCDQLIIDRPREACLQRVAHQHEGGEASVLLRAKAQGMVRPGLYLIVEIGAEAEPLPLAASLDGHAHGEKGAVLDVNQNLLGRRHEIIAAVLFLPQHRGKELDQRLPPDGAIPIIPGPVAPNLKADVPTVLRDPAPCRQGFGLGLAEGTQHALFVSSCHLERALDSSYLTVNLA